jgi:uncharacterized DUF497 family protein
MNYVWDDDKSTITMLKHGLSFEDAELVFPVSASPLKMIVTITENPGLLR